MVKSQSLPLFSLDYRESQQSSKDNVSAGSLELDIEANSDGWNFDNPTHDETLAQQRAADKIFLQEDLTDWQADTRAKVMKAKYHSFREAAKGICLKPDVQTDSKRRLLETYFPGQFSKDKQDLTAHTVMQIGKVFANLYRYAKGYSGKSE